MKRYLRLIAVLLMPCLVVADEPPQTVWTGADGVSWTSAKNWSNGVPDSSMVAKFPASAKTNTVELAGNCSAHGLLFEGNGYELINGERLELTPNDGEYAFEVAGATTNVVSVPIRLVTEVAAKIENEGLLNLSGAITGGGVKKIGRGRLRLGGTSSYTKPITIEEGVLHVARAGALGTSSGTVVHEDGTLQIAAVSQFLQTYRINSGDGMAIVNGESSCSFSGMEGLSGRFLKRGSGMVTYNFSTAAKLNLGGGEVETATAGLFTFPEDGSAPVFSDGTVWSGFPAVTVSEGTLSFGYSKVGARATLNGSILVGIATATSAAQPKFAVNSLPLEVTGALYIGHDITSGRTLQPEAEISNTSASFGSVVLGLGCGAKSVRPTFTATNSTVTAGEFKLSEVKENSAYTMLDIGKSSVIAESFTWAGRLEGEVVNSSLGATEKGSSILSGATAYSRGNLTFTAGSVCRFTGVTMAGLEYPVTLIFDDATWAAGSNGVLVAGSEFNQEGFFGIVTRGEGMTLSAVKDAELRLSGVSITGEAPVNIAGEGTVRIGAGVCNFTGPLTVESGTLDLTGAGAVRNLTVLPGEGTIRGATFKDVTISLDSWSAENLPLFDSCAFVGKTTVDFGAGEQPKFPARVPLARLTGKLPTSFEGWSIGGTRALTATFEVSDGVLYANVKSSGIFVIIK